MTIMSSLKCVWDVLACPRTNQRPPTSTRAAADNALANGIAISEINRRQLSEASRSPSPAPKVRVQVRCGLLPRSRPPTNWHGQGPTPPSEGGSLIRPSVWRQGGFATGAMTEGIFCQSVCRRGCACNRYRAVVLNLGLPSARRSLVGCVGGRGRRGCGCRRESRCVRCGVACPCSIHVRLGSAPSVSARAALPFGDRPPTEAAPPATRTPEPLHAPGTASPFAQFHTEGVVEQICNRQANDAFRAHARSEVRAKARNTPRRAPARSMSHPPLGNFQTRHETPDVHKHRPHIEHCAGRHIQSIPGSVCSRGVVPEDEHVIVAPFRCLQALCVRAVASLMEVAVVGAMKQRRGM